MSVKSEREEGGWAEQTDHPWTVMRAAELLKWTEGGEYQAVLERKTRDRVNIRFDGELQRCRKCDYRLEAGEKFCPSCGAGLRG